MIGTVTGCFLITAPLAWAVNWGKDDLDIEAVKLKPDDKGTNINNAYKFTLDLKVPDKTKVGPHHIAYFINGEGMELFYSETLPFTITRDFRGMEAGNYTIKIGIEDDDGKLVVSQSTSITVSH